MQFHMEPLALPSPSRRYQAIQKCCHGTCWPFGMVAIGVALRIARETSCCHTHFMSLCGEELLRSKPWSISSSMSVYLFHCRLSSLQFQVITLAPNKLICIPAYLYTCMPYQAILIHLGSFHTKYIAPSAQKKLPANEVSPSPRHFSVLSLGSAALSNSCRIKTWQNRSGSLQAIKSGWCHLLTVYIYIYVCIMHILHTHAC